jgi:hypothetical protein
MQRFLITFGILLVVLGVLWPWITTLGLGRLPGDIVVEREHLRFYFPITTCIIISLIITDLFPGLRTILCQVGVSISAVTSCIFTALGKAIRPWS